MLSASKHPYRWLVGLIAISLCTSAAFARSKYRTPLDQSLVPLATALQANDLDAAQLAAASIYQQATNTLALQSSGSTVIIDPVMVAQTVEYSRTKAAFEIAQCFYNHAELDIAKQWAITGTTGGTLSEQYVRRATVLLGNIASAMDRNDEAVADFTSVINLPAQYREQASAYAGLLEVLMLQKQDELVAQWVQQGRAQFAGAGDLELDFLKITSDALKRRNHPLWRDLDQQIVGLSSISAGNKLNALRRLASDARKFGRWGEAESNYAAICALAIGSPQDAVDAFLFLAESQAKQAKDFAPTLRLLQSNTTAFAQSADRDYATYRLAKFYEEHGKLDQAASDYGLLTSGSSTSTWAAAALHQLAALKERQGDLKTALDLYLQYTKKFGRNERLAVQAYGGALNVAETLGDTNLADRMVSAITNRAAKIQDYNVHLNLAFYFKKRGKQQIAQSYLESGLALARPALSLASTSQGRSLIHFRTLQRLNDFAQYQGMLNYFAANTGDLANADSTPDDYQLQCRCYKAIALMSTGHRQQALDELRELLAQAQANPELEAKFAEILGIYYSTPNDKASASELFEWAAQKYPDHPWVNIGRLELAIQRFNAGDVEAAKKLTDDITNALPENSKMDWMRSVYWGAVYLRGCCLQAQGGDGNGLKQLAMSQVPDLRIQQQLRTQ